MNLNLSPDERLEILRGADHSRHWSSIDDEHVCSLCGKSITGREIIIGSNQPGRFQLHCPTPGCAATIHDWICSTLVPSGPDQKSATIVRMVEMDFSDW